MNDIIHGRIQGAEDALDVINTTSVDNPVVVFDIDDTLIDSQTGERIEAIYTVYNYIKSLGIPIFLVTARDPISKMETRRQLANLNITGYQGLYLVGHNDVFDDKGDRKANVREMLEARGYSILLNIGDDPDDFKNGYYLYGVKLPYLY